jgi:FG-GAP-like repeat/FG-GAP repeat
MSLFRFATFTLVTIFAAQTARANMIEWGFRGYVQPAAGWSFAAGDFDADGLTDIAAYHPSDGSVWVGHNGGSNITFTYWATVDPFAGWTFRAGSFDGDALDDLVAYHPSDGTVWMGHNTGSSFVFEYWATVIPSAGWSIETGDFTGDGRTDVLAYHPSDGTVWVGRNTGSSFAFDQWATVSPPAGWTFQAGEFTRDGSVDITAYYAGDRSLWVGRNTGSSFAWELWPTFPVSVGSSWTFVAGGFSQDGACGLAAYDGHDGHVWFGRSTLNSQFHFSRLPYLADVDPASGWQFVSGRFTSAGADDLFAYHPSDGSIWIGDNRLPPEGYAWPLSASPGQTINFYTSGLLQPTAEIMRHARSGDTITATPIASINFASRVQPLATARPSRDGTGWSPTFAFQIPSGWASGIYSARIRSAQSSEEFYISFVVKPSPANISTMAVIANVNTWLAYNAWGGESKYDGAAQQSFMRPNPGAVPVGSWFQWDHLTRGELFFLSWLQEQNFQVDVYTDLDFHNGIPAGYRKLILSTHPEYWTETMYDWLEAFLAQGGSVIYVGGNGLFERASYMPNQSGMIFLDGFDGNGYRAFETYRVLTRHERAILGVGTSRCDAFDDAGFGNGFVVKRANHPVFQNTGVINNQIFGVAGGGASGHEIDTNRTSYANSLPCDIWHPSALENPPSVPSSSSPPGLVLLARASNPGKGSDNGVGADMTFYRHSGGGFVFSAGSITFGHSLSQDAPNAVLPKVMRNVLNMQ